MLYGYRPASHPAKRPLVHAQRVQLEPLTPIERTGCGEWREDWSQLPAGTVITCKKCVAWVERYRADGLREVAA